MWRSEIKTFFLLIVCFTGLLMPELFLASPASGYESEQLLKFDLMHIDHPASPLYVRDRSRTEKFLDRMARSRNWSQYITTNGSAITTFSSPIRHSPSGVFLMDLELGSPAQNFTAIMDTGSDVTWIQCSPCSGCYEQQDPLFNPQHSRSYDTVSCESHTCSLLRKPSCANDTATHEPVCQYSVHYGDQSTTTGDLSRDSITLTSVSGRRRAFDFVFGCGHSNQGTFQSTDGIVGFGQGALSMPKQVGSNFANIFSYCFDASKESSPLLLGPGLAKANFTWTPIVENKARSTFYYLNATGISVNGNLLDIPASAWDFSADGDGGLIVDSGTTVTTLVPAAFGAFIQAVRVMITYPEVDANRFGLDLCYDVSNYSNPEFPVATFHFDGGADLFLPASNLWAYADDYGTVCFALLSSSYGFSIMGNFQQQNIHLAYDLQNKRFGFQSEVDCSTL
ncbi:hypothetical protein Mapa_005402 [Marchantia paleacea]|nr:hypothetical protein Mapa_005402 [Marchantia paleacea]